VNFPKILQAGIAIMMGGGLLKFGNENYEMLKADGGLIGPIFCLLGGGALLIYGLKSLGGAFAR